MRVVIAVGLIRNPAHVADVHQAGAEAVLADLESAAADDVAVIAALLDNPGTRHQTLELTSGDSPVAAAVQSLS
jgi:hypothetical protein